MALPHPESGVSPLPGALGPAQLRRRCDLSALAFSTTDDLLDGDDILGQPRAIEAITFGIGIRDEGYNVFAMGPEGVGRRTLARRFLDRDAAARPVPCDWCYVFNFRVPHQPQAIGLPPGRGTAFRHDMTRLVDDLSTGIPAAFEADEYRTRRQEIEAELSDRQDHGVQAVGARAREQGIALLRTPGGFGFAPLLEGEVMPPDKFRELPEDERKRIETAIGVLQDELGHVIAEVPRWRREAQQKLRELNRSVAKNAIASLLDDLKVAWATLPDVVRYLSEVQDDVLDHVQDFQQRDADGGDTMAFALAHPDGEDTARQRYAVNLLIDHSGSRSAPIIYEDNPTHDNLVGRLENVSRMGVLVTDFTLIKPGALHRANGGYLILDALKLLTQPFAWEALKRALRSREVRTEPLAQALGLFSTQSLEPQPIPIEVKVVLVGQRHIYYLLHALDPEFAKLFKVAADFEEDIARSEESEHAYARLAAAMVRRNGLRALDRGAVARVVEQASRLADSAERLSVEMSALKSLLEESSHWATVAGRDTVNADDVERAIAAKLRRSDRLPERVRDEMLAGRLLIATDGERAGQVNGLSVVTLGDSAFGIPVRITARIRLGGGSVVDIERESQLGGRLHAKGVLILSGYLAAQYSPNRPPSLAATLVFEQTYGTVEGDSASCAELCALLSALADAPVKQGLAMTGSVNQHGDVQAIGGVNEKIEGFFDLCRARGLTGGQGVIIPQANASQLMLRDDVVEAVAKGRFAIRAVSTVDEALSALTGLDAGTRDALGRHPPGSLNARIEARLADLAERSRSPVAARPRVVERRPGKRS